MRSTDQVARILALIPLLQRRPGADVAEVAREFGITPRQLDADLKVIWMIGLPGPGQLIDVDMDALESDGVIHIGNADVLTRPVRFTPDEALGLVVALQSVRALAGDDLAPVVESALAKLQGVSGHHAQDTRVLIASGEQRIRTDLAAAITDRVAVELTYDGAARGGTTQPLVDPERLFVTAGAGYLQAWNREAAAWRTYRLDRIAAVTRTELPAGRHPSPPPADEWSKRLDEAATVTVELRPAARWVAEYYPVTEVTEITEGTETGDTLRVVLPVVDRDWFVALALRLGPDARVVEPDVAAAVAAAAAATLAQYEDLDADG